MTSNPHLPALCILLAMLGWGGLAIAAPVAEVKRTVLESEIKREVQSLLAKEKFAELDKLAENARRSGERTTDGAWIIHSIYFGLANIESGSSAQDRNEREHKLKNWLKARPKSLTARVAWAGYLTESAVSGFSSSESDSRAERLQQAKRVLEEAKSLPAHCPGWYFAMLQVARWQRWERPKYEVLFKEAVAFEPDYQQFHFSKARYLLRIGAPGEWKQVAQEAAALNRDRWGESYYTRVCHEIFHDYFGGDEIRSSGVDWPRMRKGFRDIMAMYPKSDFWLNALACDAVQFEDVDTARTAIAKIHDHPVIEVWNTRGFYEECRRWAFPP